MKGEIAIVTSLLQGGADPGTQDAVCFSYFVTYFKPSLLTVTLIHVLYILLWFPGPNYWNKYMYIN